MSSGRIQRIFSITNMTELSDSWISTIGMSLANSFPVKMIWDVELILIVIELKTLISHSGMCDLFYNMSSFINYVTASWGSRWVCDSDNTFVRCYLGQKIRQYKRQKNRKDYRRWDSPRVCQWYKFEKNTLPSFRRTVMLRFPTVFTSCSLQPSPSRGRSSPPATWSCKSSFIHDIFLFFT